MHYYYTDLKFDVINDRGTSDLHVSDEVKCGVKWTCCVCCFVLFCFCFVCS